MASPEHEQAVAPATVEQQVAVDAPPDEVWQILTDDPDGLDWLGPVVEVDLRPGGGGRVVDDEGTTRQVLVTEVDREHGITWHWWSDGDELSTVHITLCPFDDDARTIVHVVETIAGEPRCHVDGPRVQAFGAHVRALAVG